MSHFGVATVYLTEADAWKTRVQKESAKRHSSSSSPPWVERNNLRATPLEEKITEFPQRFIKMGGEREHVASEIDTCCSFVVVFFWFFRDTRKNEWVGGVYECPLRVASSRRRGGIYSRFDSVPATGLNHCIRTRHSVRPPYRHFVGFLVCPFPLRGRVKKKKKKFALLFGLIHKVSLAFSCFQKAKNNNNRWVLFLAHFQT